MKSLAHLAIRNRPLANSRHLPNILGCAIGFSAAGCGVGSLIGTIFGSLLYPPLPEGQGTMEEKFYAMYGGTYLGIKAGLVFGSVAGVVYAILVRRSRRQKHLKEGQSSSQADGGGE